MRKAARMNLVKTHLILLPLFAGSLALAQPINHLSDEFDSSSTLGNWQRVHLVEGWNADQLETYDIDQTTPGWMTMIPYTSVWYQDWRGVLAFKEVTGDFVATTRVRPRNRADNGPPGSQFSLSGILARQPRNITPATWTPGGENYVFLSMGAANDPGVYQFEVKTTEDSNSVLVWQDANDDEAIIQVARIGPHFLMLRRTPSGEWTVHNRYRRDAMPQTLQVGMTCYTDWPTGQTYPPAIHNATTILEGNPDLIARYDYFRFERPNIPAQLVGSNFSEPSEVNDSAILSFLGDNAGQPVGVNTPTPSPTNTLAPTETQTLPATSTATPTSTEPAPPTTTFTPTLTETPLPTEELTPTSTLPETSTPTATNTAVPTATATAPETETFTPTPQVTSTPTPEETSTVTLTHTSTPISEASPTPDYDINVDGQVDSKDLLEILLQWRAPYDPSDLLNLPLFWQPEK
jgi:hypothetical protein